MLWIWHTRMHRLLFYLIVAVLWLEPSFLRAHFFQNGEFRCLFVVKSYINKEVLHYFVTCLTIIVLFTVAQSLEGLSIRIYNRCLNFHVAMESLKHLGEISWLLSSRKTALSILRWKSKLKVKDCLFASVISLRIATMPMITNVPTFLQLFLQRIFPKKVSSPPL